MNCCIIKLNKSLQCGIFTFNSIIYVFKRSNKERIYIGEWLSSLTQSVREQINWKLVLGFGSPDMDYRQTIQEYIANDANLEEKRAQFALEIAAAESEEARNELRERFVEEVMKYIDAKVQKMALAEQLKEAMIKGFKKGNLDGVLKAQAMMHFNNWRETTSVDLANKFIKTGQESFGDIPLPDMSGESIDFINSIINKLKLKNTMEVAVIYNNLMLSQKVSPDVKVAAKMNDPFRVTLAERTLSEFEGRKVPQMELFEKIKNIKEGRSSLDNIARTSKVRKDMEKSRVEQPTSGNIIEISEELLAIKNLGRAIEKLIRDIDPITVYDGVTHKWKLKPTQGQERVTVQYFFDQVRKEHNIYKDANGNDIPIAIKIQDQTVGIQPKVGEPVSCLTLERQTDEGAWVQKSDIDSDSDWSEVTSFLGYEEDLDKPSGKVYVQYATQNEKGQWVMEGVPEFTGRGLRASWVYRDLPAALRFRAENGYLFGGVRTFDKIFNTRRRAELLDAFAENFYEKIQGPVQNHFEELFDRFPIEKVFKKMFFDGNVYSSEAKKRFMDEKGLLKTKEWNKWVKFWEKYYTKHYSKMFKNTDTDTMEWLINNRIGSIIADYISREYLKTGKLQPSTEGSPYSTRDDMINNIQELMKRDDLDFQIRKMIAHFSVGKGQTALYQAIAECAEIGVKEESLKLNTNPGAYIGAILEAQYKFSVSVVAIAEEFKKNGFEDIEGVYQWIEYTSYMRLRGDFVPDGLKASNQKDNKIIADLYERMFNAGIKASKDAPQNARIFDCIVAIFRESILSFHCKNTRKLIKNGKLSKSLSNVQLKGLAADSLSTIFPDVFLYLFEDSIPDRKHISELVGPVDPKTLNKFLEQRVAMDKLSKVIGSDGLLKGPSEQAFYQEVVEIINKEIKKEGKTTKQEVKDLILKLMKDPDINKRFKNIAKNTFGKDKAKDLGTTFYLDVRNKFSDPNVLDTIICTYSGGVEVVWVTDLGFHLKTDIPLPFSSLPENIRYYDPTDSDFVSDSTILTNSKSILTDSKFGDLIERGFVFMVCHIRNGPNQAENFLFAIPPGFESGEIYDSFSLPENAFVGYYNKEDGKRYIVLLNDRQGNVLFNKFVLVAGEFQDLGENWYETNWNEEEREIIYEGRIVKMKVLEYIRSMVWSTGKSFLPFIQEAEYRVVPVNAYNTHLPTEKISPQISRESLEVILNPNPDPKTIEKLKSLAFVLYQMIEPISLRIKRSIDVKSFFYSNDFLNLFNDGELYTISGFREIIEKGLAPRDGDPMNNPTHILYDFNLADNWLKFINRHTVFRNAEGNLELTLNDVTDKEFYNAWLTLIQNDILRGGTRFNDYIDILFKKDADGNPDLTQPKRFSLGNYFTVDERTTSFTNDIALVETIDKVMTRIFGHTGYALIFSGLMSFNEDLRPDGTSQIRVDSLLFSLPQLNHLFRRFGIKALNSRLGKLSIYDKKYFSTYALVALPSFFFSGYSHIVKCIKITENNPQGRLYGTALSIAAPSTEGGVLSDYFLLYTPSDSHSYERASSLFLNREYKKYNNELNLKRENTFGRGKLLEKIYEQIDEKLYDIFVSTKQWEQFEQFQDNPKFWHLWTGIMFRSIVRRAIDFPTNDMDKIFVKEIREAIMNQRDAKITIKIEEGGMSRLQAYASNALIKEGITIIIPYSELLSIINDIYFTLVFGYSADLPYRQLGYMSPPGFEMAFGMHWTDELQGKVMKAYDTLWQMFKIEEYSETDVYKAYFYVGSGGGMGRRATLHSSYSSLGFKSPSNFEFIPGNDMELHKAIQSILFYTFSLPDVFCIIRAGTQNQADMFLASNIFSTFSTEDIMSSSGVGKPITVNPYWDESIREKVFEHLDRDPSASDSDLLEAALIKEDDPPIILEVLEYLYWHPETTDEQLIDQFQGEPEEMLKDFNQRFKSALESLPMTKLQYEFGNLFSDTDIRFFLGFHDMGMDTHDDETQRRMLRFMWHQYFRKLFIQELGSMGEERPEDLVNLEDLTIPEFLRER